MGKFTFRKEERLIKEKQIQELFDKGSSFYLFPFKVFFMPGPEPLEHHQILISVSKRNFKRAVDRNLIKRRMREAYRLQKQFLPEAPPLMIGYIYAHKEILLFEEIKRRMLQSFKKIPKAPVKNSGSV
jgi:ribonuclease P protein component